MNLFYTPPEKVQEHKLILVDDEARHAEKVLRYRVGDTIHVSDGVGSRHEGHISFIGNKTIQVDIRQTYSEQKPCELVLALGLIKNRQRLEYAVEKAVELGATEIVLFKSDHSERGKVNRDRLQAIALSAMKQSLRPFLPRIYYNETLSDAVTGYNDHVFIVAHEKANDETLELFKHDKNYLILVGPEGGFSDDEINTLQKNKARVISLGKYRLRSETAVAALLSRFV
ncbi:MAG: RsmE family RNA methyltransferase [Balneolales bacterium]